MSILNPLIDIPATQYYFDTFVVGAHHSVPHMIYDLLKRKESAEAALNEPVLEYKRKEYTKLIEMIDEKLSTLDMSDLDDLEAFEPTYWINELSRRAALEINSYGRVRPETLDLLLCVEEDDFLTIMKIVTGITTRIRIISESSEAMSAPVPSTMARHR
jgi:hypothetical protein